MSEIIDKAKGLKDVILNKKKIEKNKKNKFSKEEQTKHTIAWTTFYRRNLHIFAEEYLGIKLKFFQKCMLYLMGRYRIIVFIMCRGAGKSFTISIFAISMALLYPNSEIMIASLTLNQASLIIKEKLDKELCGELALSPILKYLKDNKYISFKYDKDKAECKIKNGSKIFSAVCGEESRGNRSTILIVDEARLVKKKDVDQILIPTLRPRVYPARLKLEYADWLEEPKQIFLSSAKTKDSWLYKFMIKTVNNFYHHNYIDTNDKDSYAFLAVDIFTIVANGIKTITQMKSDKQNTDELSYEMESLNIWLGENEDSLFTYDMFHQQQVLETAFIPTKEYLPFKKRRKDGRTNIISMDIAVSSGRDNDNTVFTLGYLEHDSLVRGVEYIRAYNGMNSMKQVVLLKRLFYDYDCEYCVIDSKGIGNTIFDALTVETYDEETGNTYPAWTVVEDSFLQISSNAVIDDKIKRTIDKDAKRVVIPIAGTLEINSSVHLAMRKNLNDHIIEFLKDDNEMELILAKKDKEWFFKTSEERADDLLPYLETKYMINESVALQRKMSGGNIAVKEDRNATKDRYMSCGYFNLFCDKLAIKIQKEIQDESSDISDIQLVW